MLAEEAAESLNATSSTDMRALARTHTKVKSEGKQPKANTLYSPEQA